MQLDVRIIVLGFDAALLVLVEGAARDAHLAGPVLDAQAHGVHLGDAQVLDAHALAIKLARRLRFAHLDAHAVQHAALGAILAAASLDEHAVRARIGDPYHQVAVALDLAREEDGADTHAATRSRDLVHDGVRVGVLDGRHADHIARRQVDGCAGLLQR
jgi:hypothetical protein